MKKPTFLIVAVALLAASCGAGPETSSDLVVAQVLSSLSEADDAAPATTAPPPSLPPGCIMVSELDNYGFEVDVLDCGERPDPGIENPNWLGSESAELAATMLRTALVDQDQCGTRATYGELKTLVIEAAAEYSEPLLEAIASLEQGAAHCNKDKDAWAAAMSEALVHFDTFLRAVERNIVTKTDQEPR